MSIGGFCMFFLCMFGCSEPEHPAPEVGPAMPANTVWAGGVDGGAFISCTPIRQDRYRCKTYHENGMQWSEGEYVIRRSKRNEVEKKSDDSAAEAPATLEFTGYDGEVIHLTRDLVLLPDGWILFPFEVGGKKQFFRAGEPQGDEVSY